MVTRSMSVRLRHADSSPRPKVLCRSAALTFPRFCALVVWLLMFPVASCGQSSSARHSLSENSQCRGVNMFGDSVSFIVEAKTEPLHLPDSRSEFTNCTWLLVHRQAGEKWARPSRPTDCRPPVPPRRLSFVNGKPGGSVQSERP